MRSLKRQHLTTLQRSLDNTARHLSFRAPIVATPGFLKLTLTLGFSLDHHNDLVTGLHQFGIFQHTSASRKLLKARADRHQVIAGGGAAPSLADAATIMAPDGVSLPATLSVSRGAHTWLRVVLVTLFGPDYPTTLEMKEVNT